MQARFPFRFDPAYRRLARLFGVTPERAWVDLGDEELEARYGRWRVRTPRNNIAGVEATGRDTAVLVGMETDVCVAQSALGLLDRGLRVAVVSDATYSPGTMHDHGLRRIADAGGVVVHAKGVYYEWVRTVDAALAFERAHPDLAAPPGFRL